MQGALLCDLNVGSVNYHVFSNTIVKSDFDLGYENQGLLSTPYWEYDFKIVKGLFRKKPLT
jgi:hypothetical protein